MYVPSLIRRCLNSLANCSSSSRSTFSSAGKSNLGTPGGGNGGGDLEIIGGGGVWLDGLNIAKGLTTAEGEVSECDDDKGNGNDVKGGEEVANLGTWDLRSEIWCCNFRSWWSWSWWWWSLEWLWWSLRWSLIIGLIGPITDGNDRFGVDVVSRCWWWWCIVVAKVDAEIGGGEEVWCRCNSLNCCVACDTACWIWLCNKTAEFCRLLGCWNNKKFCSCCCKWCCCWVNATWRACKSEGANPFNVGGGVVVVVVLGLARRCWSCFDEL